MQKVAWLLGVLAVSVYLGCDGDSEENAALDAGADVGVDSAHPLEEAGPDSNVDAGADVNTDVQDAADIDVQVFACAVMNTDSGATFGDASCNDCMSTSCCDEVTGCFGNTECADRVACVRTCDGGPACKNACTAAYFDAGTSFSAVSLCAGGSCGAAAGCGTFP